MNALTGAQRIAKARGWKWYEGAYTINRLDAENPPRQGVAWNTKETQDLINGHFSGKTLKQLAHYHGRSEGGIQAQLSYSATRNDTRSHYEQALKAAQTGGTLPSAKASYRPQPPAEKEPHAGRSSGHSRRGSVSPSGSYGGNAYAKAGRRSR